MTKNGYIEIDTRCVLSDYIMGIKGAYAVGIFGVIVLILFLSGCIRQSGNKLTENLESTSKKAEDPYFTGQDIDNQTSVEERVVIKPPYLDFDCPCNVYRKDVPFNYPRRYLQLDNQTQSMSLCIDPNKNWDVEVASYPYSDLQVCDVVAYRLKQTDSRGRTYYFHRIVQKNVDGTFYTKGDMTDKNDFELFREVLNRDNYLGLVTGLREK